MRRIALDTEPSAAIVAVDLLSLSVWPIGAAPQLRLAQFEGDLKSSAYLARASGCIACHTNSEGGAPLAGGVALDTFFGTLYSPNLTNDAENGIGDWTIEQFSVAVRQGISPEGEPYYPAFTYPFYGDFTDQQIADLWAAFQTVPPVDVASKAPDMAFPFDQRASLKLWRALFLYDPDTEPVPEQSEEWNRGKRLVEGATHCGACHTKRNTLGGRLVTSEKFAGSDMLPRRGKAPAINAETLKMRGRDADSLAYGLKTGITPSGDAFGNAMGEVVRFGTQYFSPDDLDATASYLMDQPE